MVVLFHAMLVNLETNRDLCQKLTSTMC